MNLRISKWANVGEESRWAFVTENPRWPMFYPPVGVKMLSCLSEAWTKECMVQHGKVIVYTRGSGSRGHGGDKRGWHRKWQMQAFHVFGTITLPDLLSKCVSSRKGNCYLPCSTPLASDNTPNSHSGAHLSGDLGFSSMENISARFASSIISHSTKGLMAPQF